MLKCFKVLIAFVIVAGIIYLGHGFVLDKAGRWLYYKDELKPADVIVVLAGEETERVEYGARLFRDDRAKKDKVILAGGPLVWKYTWASLMQEHAVHLGIPRDAIILQGKSRSTEEDARFTKEIMDKNGFKSCILVTSPYHSRRAAMIFRKVMGDETKIINAPADRSWLKFGDWWKRRKDRAVVLNEYSKFLWLLMFGIETAEAEKISS